MEFQRLHVSRSFNCRYYSGFYLKENQAFLEGVESPL